MRLIKILLIISILFLLALSSVWFYATKKISLYLNEYYSNKEFSIDGIDKTNYFILFDRISPSGYPSKIAWKVNGWREESRTASIVYNSPLEFGYDFLAQNFFIHYDGEIIASYKPSKGGFGARLLIRDYNITLDMPLNFNLLKKLKNINNPFQLINHVADIKISSNKVEIFDLIDNEKFYDKAYEKAKCSFVPQKTYENSEDFLSHIPQEYNINYVVKINPNDAIARRLPVSLFYGFSLLPAGFNLNFNMDIKTSSNNFDEFMKEVEIKTNIDSSSKYINLENISLSYKAKNYRNEFILDVSSKITIKDGLFDMLFEKYSLYAASQNKSPIGALIERDLSYLIQNKETYSFKDLENITFDMGLKMNSYTSNDKKYLKIEDFNITTDKSGIRLRHEMESKFGSKNEWFLKGILFITNYPTTIELASKYVYKFDKFKFLNDKARILYANLNKSFLKNISDHPDSESNDLSFEYDIDSKNLSLAKVGSSKMNNLKQIYDLTLYQKLLETVGYGGDVLGRIREILPEIDGHEPFLEKILPSISGDSMPSGSISGGTLGTSSGIKPIE